MTRRDMLGLFKVLKRCQETERLDGFSLTQEVAIISRSINYRSLDLRSICREHNFNCQLSVDQRLALGCCHPRWLECLISPGMVLWNLRTSWATELDEPKGSSP